MSTGVPRQQKEVEDKYERRGDHYQCKICDQFTVHYKNDCMCLNKDCKSNLQRKQVPKQSSGSSAYKATATTKRTAV